jgi:hypothetical protein
MSGRDDGPEEAMRRLKQLICSRSYYALKRTKAVGAVQRNQLIKID